MYRPSMPPNPRKSSNIPERSKSRNLTDLHHQLHVNLLQPARKPSPSQQPSTHRHREPSPRAGSQLRRCSQQNPIHRVIQQVEPSLCLLTKEAADNICLLVTQALSTATPPKPNTTKEEQRKPTKGTPLSSWTRPTTTTRTSQYRDIYMPNSGNILYQPSRDDSTRNCSPYTRKTSSPSLYTSNYVHHQPPAQSCSDNPRSTSPQYHSVSTRGSPTYNTAQHLATILQPLVGQSCRHVITSSTPDTSSRKSTTSTSAQQTSRSASTSSLSSLTFLSPKPATSSRLDYSKTPHLTPEQPYLQNKFTTYMYFLHASTKHH